MVRKSQFTLPHFTLKKIITILFYVQPFNFPLASQKGSSGSKDQKYVAGTLKIG